MMRFRKKPLEIEAEQLRWDNWSQVCELLMHGDVPPNGGRACGLTHAEAAELFPNAGVDTEHEGLIIYALVPTLEGDRLATEGDWIIRGVKGELYPCKPDVFEATYEPVAGA